MQMSAALALALWTTIENTHELISCEQFLARLGQRRRASRQRACNVVETMRSFINGAPHIPLQPLSRVSDHASSLCFKAPEALTTSVTETGKDS